MFIYELAVIKIKIKIKIINKKNKIKKIITFILKGLNLTIKMIF